MWFPWKQTKTLVTPVDGKSKLCVTSPSLPPFTSQSPSPFTSQSPTPPLLSSLSLPCSEGLGAILPMVKVASTTTRRAVEPTWLTASNAKVTSPSPPPSPLPLTSLPLLPHPSPPQPVMQYHFSITLAGGKLTCSLISYSQSCFLLTLDLPPLSHTSPYLPLHPLVPIHSTLASSHSPHPHISTPSYPHTLLSPHPHIPTPSYPLHTLLLSTPSPSHILLSTHPHRRLVWALSSRLW